MPSPLDIDPPVAIPLWVEAAAIVAGSIAGTLRGIRDKLAFPGVVALVVALGLGGGIIRDTLLQSGTPVAFTSSWFLPIALVPILPVLLLTRLVSRLEWMLFAVDALSIGLYSVLGADKALQYGVPPVGSLLIGVLAGTGGGVLADLIVGVPPVLFRPGLLLGVASALGTTVYIVGAEVTHQRALWFIVGVVIITSLRIVSIATGWGVGSVHELTERSEAVLDRLPRWSELQHRRRSDHHVPGGGTVHVDTANVDTANVDTANVDTANVDTADVDTADVDTASVDTANGRTPDGDTPDGDTAGRRHDGGRDDGSASGRTRRRRRRPSAAGVGLDDRCQLGR